jgi:hypothetical protein
MSRCCPGCRIHLVSNKIIQMKCKAAPLVLWCNSRPPHVLADAGEREIRFTSRRHARRGWSKIGSSNAVHLRFSRAKENKRGPSRENSGGPSRGPGPAYFRRWAQPPSSHALQPPLVQCCISLACAALKIMSLAVAWASTKIRLPHNLLFNAGNK